MDQFFQALGPLVTALWTILSINVPLWLVAIVLILAMRRGGGKGR